MSQQEHTKHTPRRDTMTRRNGWYDPPVTAPSTWKRMVFRFAEGVRAQSAPSVRKIQRAASRFALQD